MQHPTIVILTGAGISAESGLATFRAQDGLWCNHRIEDVATPEAYRRNPALVQEFYNMRRRQLKDVSPNAAHLAISHLAEQWPGNILLVTQNVDDLHERSEAGKTLRHTYARIAMHGELKKVRCSASEEVFPWEDDITAESICPCCTKTGRLRPHIVWFGEMPLQMEVIYHWLRKCDLFMSIGTSGNVYPAAGFVQEVRGHTVELNLEPSLGESQFSEKIYGVATEIVPRYVERILAGEVV